MALYFIHRRLVDQRADDTAVGQAVAYLQRIHAFGELGDEGIVNAVLHQEAVSAYAGLPGVAELGGDGTVHGGVHIGVVKHDERRVAAQLHGGFLHRAGALCK